MASLAFTTTRSYPQTIRMIVIFGLLWLAVLAVPAPDLKVVGLYAIFYVVIVSAVAGSSLLVRLSSARAQTIPGYRGGHIAVALGLCLSALIVSAAIGGFRGLPLTSLLLRLWSASLLVLICSYAMRSLTWSFPRVGIIAVAAWPATALALLAVGPNSHVTGTMGPAAQLLLFIVNGLVTILSVRRMFHLTEEAFEYFHSDRSPRSAAVHGKETGVRSAALDSIQPLLPSNLWSRLRHLELGLFPGRLPFLPMVGILTVVFLFLGALFRDNARALFVGWAAGQMVPFFSTREKLRRFFMLPLPRRQLVAQGGTALFLVELRLWSAAALAFAISNWSARSAEFLLISLLFQLPLFGILTLTLSVHTSWMSATLLLLIPAVMVLGGAATWLGAAPVQVPIAVSLVGGAGLIWLAYYRWCNVELD